MGGIACPAKAGVRRSVFHFTAIIPQFKNLARLGLFVHGTLRDGGERSPLRAAPHTDGYFF
jgi:hypothetical protein